MKKKKKKRKLNQQMHADTQTQRSTEPRDVNNCTSLSYRYIADLKRRNGKVVPHITPNCLPCALVELSLHASRQKSDALEVRRECQTNKQCFLN